VLYSEKEWGSGVEVCLRFWRFPNNVAGYVLLGETKTLSLRVFSNTAEQTYQIICRKQHAAKLWAAKI